MSKDRWYYLEQDQSVGPFTWSRLSELRAAGIIQNDTLVWSSGAEWLPFSSVTAKRESSPPAPPIDPRSFGGDPQQAQSRDRHLVPRATSYSSDVAVDARGWTSAPPAPWRRYFGRLLDIMVNGLVGFIILSVALYAFVPITADRFFSAFDGPAGRLLDVFLTVLISLPVTAVLVGLTGSSAGKWIFGTRIVDPELRPIGFRRALSREFRAWFTGLALGIPIISLIAMYLSYSRLKETGKTNWDAALGTLVLHRPSGTSQTILNIVGILVLVSIVVALRSLE